MDRAPAPPAPQRIVIACQGGGSHTAFTAGVLKTLLARLDPARHRILGLSGTSGGAICALLAWYGLLLGDRAKGIELLESFWHDMAATDPLDAFGNDWLVGYNRLRGIVALPYLNPYFVPDAGRQKLAGVLQRHVPFDRLPGLIDERSPRLLVGAVDVLNGEFEVFSERHADPERRITLDALLASAALPDLFRAVAIGGRLYWDGLFSQNPPIHPFLVGGRDDKPDEIWVVQINPKTRHVEPQSSKEIEDRRNELAGNLSLMQEIGSVLRVNQWIAAGWLPAEFFKPIEVRFLCLDLELDAESKLDRKPAFIRMLIEHGEALAAGFLDRLPPAVAAGAAAPRGRRRARSS